MSIDLKILPDKQGRIESGVYGATEDTAQALLQRLLVLMLSGGGEAQYRDGVDYDLLNMIGNVNMMADEAMAGVIGGLLDIAKSELAQEDRDNIESLDYEATAEGVEIRLTPVNGMPVTGTIYV